MKFLKLSIVPSLGVLALVTFASPLAVADDTGWYVGGSVGQSRVTFDEERMIAGLLASGFTTTSWDVEGRKIGFKLLGGYQFNRNFALESGYFELGKFNFTATTAPAGTLGGSIESKGFNLDAVGIVPITERFAALGRIGMEYAHTDTHFNRTGLVVVPNDRRSAQGINHKFGIGLQYTLTPSFDIRTEAERYRVKDGMGNRGDMDLFSLGFIYRFGQTAVVAAREPMAPPPPIEPAPAPVPAPAPAPVATERYCSLLDIQFEIKQDDIQREEKEKLGVIGTFLQKYPNTKAVIEGHTDNVGKPEDNMRLSQRRAEGVISYLVDTFKIAPSRLTAKGFGETRPIADNSTQDGKRMNRRIGAVIACVTDIEGLTVIPARIMMALEIEFDANKADVKPQYHDDLRKVANFLKANPSVTATVEGHTANLQATEALGQEMSKRRAQNVVNYLVDNFGVARSRLTAEGFGQTRRDAYNTTAAGQQENRRVNIIINYAKKK